MVFISQNRSWAPFSDVEIYGLERVGWRSASSVGQKWERKTTIFKRKLRARPKMSRIIPPLHDLEKHLFPTSEKPLGDITQAHLVARVRPFKEYGWMPASARESNPTKIQDFLQEHLDELQARILLGICPKRLSQAVANRGKPLFHLQAVKCIEPINADEAFFRNRTMAFPNLVYLECKLWQPASSNNRLFLPHLKTLSLHDSFDTSKWSLPSLKNLVFDADLGYDAGSYWRIPPPMPVPEMFKTIRQFGHTLAFLGVLRFVFNPRQELDIWNCCPRLTGLRWGHGIENPIDSNPPVNHPLQYLLVDLDYFNSDNRSEFITFLRRFPNLRAVSTDFLPWDSLSRKRGFLSKESTEGIFVSTAKEIEAMNIRVEDRNGQSFKEFEDSKVSHVINIHSITSASA
ncbi:hypothetical protein CPB86DRAFT_409874 [Serendipita vermifera]|nr:hypothetical protein CPB86DRAFT_409874 [Serendipita vermifera]